MNRPKDITSVATDGGNSNVMEVSSQGQASLIASIESDVQAEEAKILQDAAGQVSQREQYTDKKIESMLSEARQKAARQGEMIRSKAISQAELEIKRRRLRACNEIICRIMSMVEQKLGLMIGNDMYREVLIGWIVEAALGLGVNTAMINASTEERAVIDESLVDEVQAGIQQSGGLSMTIRLADEPALALQGIILTTENGRMAYNNQVKTRLLRQQRDIQRLIHDTLFAEEQ